MGAAMSCAMAVHAGYIDTDLTAAVNAPKSRPEDIAVRVIQALRGGSEEVLSDDTSRRAKLGLNATPPFYLDPNAWTVAIQNGGH
jgi:hypothetical protein